MCVYSVLLIPLGSVSFDSEVINAPINSLGLVMRTCNALVLVDSPVVKRQYVA